MGRAGDGGGSAPSGQELTGAAIATFVKARIGSVKSPKQVEIWPDLPRSKVGKVLKGEIKQQLQNEAG